MKITFTLHAESRNMTLMQCKIYNKAENGQTILAFPSIIAGPELQSPAEKIDMGSAGIYPVPWVHSKAKTMHKWPKDQMLSDLEFM